MKLPIPTYRSDDFMGKTHVCGISDVEKIVFALWVSRAKTCKYFDYSTYFEKHPNSRVSLSHFISRMIIAKKKCLRMANCFWTVYETNF